VGSFDVTTNADFIISNIRSHWNIYANTVDKLREFGCSVIEGFNAPYIISPVAMPVGAFETLDQEEKNALYVRLQYERWCEQTIVTVAGLLPQPIAEEICPHV
jgi:hypothetical protein